MTNRSDVISTYDFDEIVRQNLLKTLNFIHRRVYFVRHKSVFN